MMKNNGIQREELSVARTRSVTSSASIPVRLACAGRRRDLRMRKVVQGLVAAQRPKVVVLPRTSPRQIPGRAQKFYWVAERKIRSVQVTGHSLDRSRWRIVTTVEAVALPGRGKIITTGKLGEVMQESIRLRSRWCAGAPESPGHQETSTRSRHPTSTCQVRSRKDGRPPALPSAAAVSV